MPKYFKFNITTIPSSATITSATLNLYATDPSADGPMLYLTNNNYRGTTTLWTETGLNFNNRPYLSGSVLANKAGIAANTWVNYDITTVVKTSRNKLYSFGLIPDNRDGVRFASKENGNAALNPYIQIKY